LGKLSVSMFVNFTLRCVSTSITHQQDIQLGVKPPQGCAMLKVEYGRC